MKSVDLRTGFLVAGYADFESAFAASEKFCEKGFKVAYLNEASFVRELEARAYIRGFDAADALQYQNYHFTSIEQAKPSALESLRTALEVLNEKNGFAARFILVLAPQKVKAARPEKKNVSVAAQ